MHEPQSLISVLLGLLSMHSHLITNGGGVVNEPSSQEQLAVIFFTFASCPGRFLKRIKIRAHLRSFAFLRSYLLILFIYTTLPFLFPTGLFSWILFLFCLESKRPGQRNRKVYQAVIWAINPSATLSTPFLYG